MKHIIMRLTCWLWVDWWGFWGWLCTVSGGRVGTGLGAQVGFWDWEAPLLPFRLLAWPCSFWKVFTACVGGNDKNFLVNRSPLRRPLISFSPSCLSNSPVGEIYWLSGCQGRHPIGYMLGRCVDLNPARQCEYLSKKQLKCKYQTEERPQQLLLVPLLFHCFSFISHNNIWCTYVNTDSGKVLAAIQCLHI